MENNIKDVPYIVHESITVKLEHTIKRLWILCIILVGLLVATNIVWVIYEQQFEITEVTQDVDTGNGDNTTVIGIGDHNGKD